MSIPRTYLTDGDPMHPASTDIVTQTIHLPVGVTPKGNGWSILTGNVYTNFWARVCYRSDAQEASELKTLGELLND